MARASKMVVNVKSESPWGAEWEWGVEMLKSRSGLHLNGHCQGKPLSTQSACERREGWHLALLGVPCSCFWNQSSMRQTSTARVPEAGCQLLRDQPEGKMCSVTSSGFQL